MLILVVPLQLGARVEVRATLPKFTTAVHTNLPLAVGQQAHLNLTLHADIAETVLVVATPAAVDTRTSTMSAIVRPAGRMVSPRRS